MGKNENQSEITLADLDPDLSPEEREEAEYRLLGYLSIVRTIWNRYEREGKRDELLREIRKERSKRR